MSLNYAARIQAYKEERALINLDYQHGILDKQAWLQKTEEAHEFWTGFPLPENDKKPPFRKQKVAKRVQAQGRNEHRKQAAQQMAPYRKRNSRGRFVRQDYVSQIPLIQQNPLGNPVGPRGDDTAKTQVSLSEVHRDDFQGVTRPSPTPEGRSISITTEFNLPTVGPTSEWEDMVMELNNYTRPQLMQKYIAKVGELTYCKREYEKCKRDMEYERWLLGKAVYSLRLFKQRIPADASIDLIEALNEWQDGVYDRYTD